MLVFYSFLLPYNIPVNSYTKLFIYSSVDEHLGCFHFGAIINNFAKNIHVQILCGHVFNFLEFYKLELEMFDHLVTKCSFLKMRDIMNTLCMTVSSYKFVFQGKLQSDNRIL